MNRKTRCKELLMITMLVFSMLTGLISPTSAPDSAAKTKKSVITLSKKKVTLKSDKKYTLKLKNVPQKAKTTWTVTKGKKNISLSSAKRTSVKIKAKKNGTAKVTAKIKLPKIKKPIKLVCVFKIKLTGTDPSVDPTAEPQATLPPHITPEGQAELKVVNGVLQASNLKNVYEVTIPDGVKEIPDEAFAFCHTLEKVTFPEGLEKIGKKAFNDCTRLNDVIFPSTLKTIGKEAFFECSSLENVRLNDGLISIGAGSFFQCKNLKSIEIPSTVNEIGDYCFAWCERMESAKINAHLTEIPREMFDTCTTLRDVNIPETVKKIGSRAFMDCFAIENLVIPEGVEEIDESGFSGCRFSNQVINVKTIGDYAFKAATLLEIELGDKVESVGKSAFESCGNGEKGSVFTIPASLTGLDESSISETSIKEYRVAEGNPVLKSVEGVLYSKDGKKLISFPGYKKLKNYTIPDGVEEICDNAFKGAHISEKIVLPKGVKKIGEHAFEMLSAKKIVLPDGITKIGEKAFSNACCTELILPDSVTEIGDAALTNMEKLKKVKLPAGLKKISYNLFEGDALLKSVEIPASVEWIDPAAFSGCAKLVDFSGVKFDEGADFSVKDGMLFDKSGEKLLAYPDMINDVEKIPRIIEVPEGTTEIGDYALQIDTLAVKIPDSVKKIGRYAFGYLTGAKRVESMGVDKSIYFFHIISSSKVALDYAKEYSLDIVSEEDPDYFYKNQMKSSDTEETKEANVKQISLKAGETVQMDAKGVITDHYFFSSDKNIATVDLKTGKIKAVAKGITTIVEVSGTLYYCLEVNVTDGPEPKHDGSLMEFADKDDAAVDKWSEAYLRYNPSLWFNAIDYPAIQTYSSNMYNAVTAPYFGKDSTKYSNYKVFITDAYGKGNGEYFNTISENLKVELSEPKLDMDILFYSGKNAMYGVDYITKDGGTSIESLLASINTTMTYPNVISTSLYQSVADGFSGGRMCAIVEFEGRKEKVNGMMINAISMFPTETEFLLNQGLKYKIIDAGVKRFFTGEGKIASVKPYIRVQFV